MAEVRPNVKEAWRNVGWGRGEGLGVKEKNGAACNAVASRYKNQNKLQRLGSIVNFILLYFELYCFLSTNNVSINKRKLYVNRMMPSKFHLWFLYTVDGQWSEWKPWTECTRTCGGGVQTRARTCTQPSPAYGGKDCEGRIDETRPCGTDACPGKLM